MTEALILDERAVSEIEARATAATKGPWTLYTGGAVTAGQERHCVAKVEFPRLPESIVDGQFIAHAREDIPALCATVKHQQKILVWIETKLSQHHPLLDDYPLEQRLQAALHVICSGYDGWEN